MRSSTFQAVELEVVGARRRLDAHAEEQVLRVAQEALVNAVRHARAHQARVLLCFAADALLLQVRDDGDGIPEQGANPAGFGLVGMRERALSIGATLEIESRPGQGTTVSLRIGAAD
jgi:signal transduction histidine kinase